MSAASPPKPEFPARLKAARELRDWNQAVLAQKAGFQASAISRFETGAAKPSLDNLRRLATALRVSTDYLLGVVNEPTGTSRSDPLYRKFQELTDDHREFAERFLNDLVKLGERSSRVTPSSPSPYTWATHRAEKLVRDWGMNTLPIDVESIARNHAIEVQAMPASIKGVSGMLQRAGDNYGIAYATNIDNVGFQRFSIAHELGHYFLDGHFEKLLSKTGTHESQAGFGSGDKFEMEADHFAAGLLMPNPLFKDALVRAGSGFTAVERLSTQFATSLEATAIRYAENTDQAAAVIVSEGQKVRYCFMSNALREARDLTWIRKGEIVPEHTTTAVFNRDSEKIERAEKVEGTCNLHDWFGGGPDVEMTEDVVGLGRYGKTLTVLVADEWPDDENEDDEDLSDFNPTFHRSRRR